MELLFSKMHGLGNDFVVIDGYTRAINLNPEQIRFLADRRVLDVISPSMGTARYLKIWGMLSINWLV